MSKINIKNVTSRIEIIFGSAIKFCFKNKEILIILLVSIVVNLFCIFDNSNHSLAAHDEGLYSRRARVIVDTGDWFTPFSEPHHKTIGSYWLIALSIRILGLNETAVRLPSAIFSILCSVFLYKVVKELINKRSALISGLILPVMPIWFLYSHYASPDIPFIFFILLSINFIIQSNINFASSNHDFSKYWFYIGICLSIAFFLRSFMVFLPMSF